MGMREGLPARIAAQAVLSDVLRKRRPLDAALAAASHLEPRDAGFARAIASETLRRFGQLEALIRKFENETEPYRSLNLPMWTNRYGAYDDLARIKEWSAAGGLGLPEW